MLRIDTARVTLLLLLVTIRFFPGVANAALSFTPEELCSAQRDHVTMAVWALASVLCTLMVVALAALTLKTTARFILLAVRAVSRSRWQSGYSAGARQAQALYEQGKEDALKEIRAGKNPWR